MPYDYALGDGMTMHLAMRLVMRSVMNSVMRSAMHLTMQRCAQLNDAFRRCLAAVAAPDRFSFAFFFAATGCLFE